MTTPAKRGAIGALLELYKSFSTLNFTIVLGAVLFAWFAGMLEPERVTRAYEMLRSGPPAPPAEEAPPDYAPWKDLPSLEARSEFLEKKYWRLEEERKTWEKEREFQTAKAAMENAALAKLRTEIESATKVLAADEKKFDDTRKAWQDSTAEESFQAQVAVLIAVKEAPLADLLLASRGMDGDAAIVRVLRAFQQSNPKKAAKLVDAMIANESGGTRRVLDVLKLWLEGKVSDEELERVAAGRPLPG